MHLLKECSLAGLFASTICTGEIFLIKTLVGMGSAGSTVRVGGGVQPGGVYLFLSPNPAQ